MCLLPQRVGFILFLFALLGIQSATAQESSAEQEEWRVERDSIASQCPDGEIYIAADRPPGYVEDVQTYLQREGPEYRQVFVGFVVDQNGEVGGTFARVRGRDEEEYGEYERTMVREALRLTQEARFTPAVHDGTPVCMMAGWKFTFDSD